MVWLRALIRGLFIRSVSTALVRASDPRKLLRDIEQIVDRTALARAPHGLEAVRSAQTGTAYLAPSTLRVTDRSARRVLVVGSCLAEVWARALPIPIDFVATNDLHRLPADPPHAPESYDAQIVQLPLRWPMPEAQFWHLAYAGEAAYAAVFEQSVAAMRAALALACAWNVRYGLLTFVTNFFVPQQNAMGRLFPRYDLRNPAYFVEQLNAALEAELAEYANAYLLDVDGIATAFGKRFIQDDGVSFFGHGALLENGSLDTLDAARIEVPAAMGDHYPLGADAFLQAAWEHVDAMLRTISRTDEVKLVIVDLDDTLWRGVLGEGDHVDQNALEGWPLGIVEALCILKKRGILLAIVSKNDEARVRTFWDAMFGSRLLLDDFAVIRISWQPKAAGVDDVLRAVNVLPENTVFIDDNPVERAAVTAAFPAIRVLGKYPYYLRRVLLWSPETQVAHVSDESGRRTEMVRAHIRRDDELNSGNRADFLQTLDVRVTMFTIASGEDPHFERALELINKTNQFNTTGRRWRRTELLDTMRAGITLRAFSVVDRFVDYGIVGAIILDGSSIQQFVMSCRVIGLDVENSVFDILAADIAAAGAPALTGYIVATETNFVCRDVFAYGGFAETETGWTRTRAPARV